jgi:Amt family ammonium transporter
MGAIIMGFLGGIVCYWGVNGLKRMLGVDDSLDVFGVHGVGGILGALLTGVFAPRSWADRRVGLRGQRAGTFDMGAQMVAQAWGVGTAVVWSGWCPTSPSS